MVKLKCGLALLMLALSSQAVADFPTARALFEKQEYALAKPQLETLAELGHLEAQFLLSRMYAEGLGVDKDMNLAYAWTLIAKERNHPLADKQYRKLRTQLDSRLEGKEVYATLSSQFGKQALDSQLYPTTNRYVAFDRRVKAISKNEPDFPAYIERSGIAAWAIVHYDINEDGRTENAQIVASFPVDAISDFVLEAVATWQFQPPKDAFGDPVRLEMQSHMFKVNAQTNSKSRKFDRENQQYLEAIHDAAKAESAKYQYLYGLLTENQVVPGEDPMYWYLQAAINGFPAAQYRLAQCLVSGNGCDKDPSKAVNWLAISADSGDAKSAFLLAQELLDSNNVNYDPQKAAFYLEVAALKEYMPAITEYAALLAMTDNPALRDPQKAIRLAEQGRAIDANNPNLLSTLGVAFIELGQQSRGESMLKQALAEARKRNWTLQGFEDLLADYQVAVNN